MRVYGLRTWTFLTIFTQQALLDFSKEPFDVELLDRVVMAFYSGSGAEVGNACLLTNYRILMTRL